MTSENPNSPRSFPSWFWQWLRQASTLIGTGTLAIAVVGSSMVAYSIMRQQLLFWLEFQREIPLDSPVTIGEFADWISLSDYLFQEIQIRYEQFI